MTQVQKHSRSRSIEELEGSEWPSPGREASPLAIACHAARRKPLSTLSTGEIRLLMNQDVGLPFLVPMALEILEKDPLMEVDYFRGDLLAATLHASPIFYEASPEMRARLEKVLKSVPVALDKLDHIDFDSSSEALEEAIARFRSSRK